MRLAIVKVKVSGTGVVSCKREPHEAWAEGSVSFMSHACRLDNLKLGERSYEMRVMDSGGFGESRQIY